MITNIQNEEMLFFKQIFKNVKNNFNKFWQIYDLGQT